MLAARHCLVKLIQFQIPRVLIVMAIETQQFPVASVGRVVLVVVVFVMDRELAKFFALEFTPAPRTDPGKNL